MWTPPGAGTPSHLLDIDESVSSLLCIFLKDMGMAEDSRRMYDVLSTIKERKRATSE